MDDWKVELKKKLAVRAQAEAEKKEAEHEASVAKDMAARASQVRELGVKFQCHVCGRPSKEPDTVREEHHRPESELIFSEYVEDWNHPGDLYRCKVCGQWTCRDDYAEGYCKLCASRL
jgi:hypothetical protein